MSNTLFFLVDMASVGTDAELAHLLSFGEVEGVRIEQDITLIERPGQGSLAVLGAAGVEQVSLTSLEQFKRFAIEIASRPDCEFEAAVVERALAFAYLADRLGADAIVSPARLAFGPADTGLLDGRKLISVTEALAMIGAHVRQREEVPLGGLPMLVQQRSEVYPMTARVIIPNGQAWWSACVQTGRNDRELLGHGEAVFKRVGQALRGRDAVHETLRLEAGRSAILDALYHFDVVLTSTVASLDALARATHSIFGMTSRVEQASWQKRTWREDLARLAPSVAAVVAPSTRLGAALVVLSRLRNSVHSIPLDEYLQVNVGSHDSRVEHRAMIMGDLGQRLRDGTGALGPLDSYGIFINDTGTSFLNVAQLTEQLLAWTIEIIGELLGATLSCIHFVGGTTADFTSLEILERNLCVALARVGDYPCSTGPTGLRASASLHRRVVARIREHLPK